MIIVPLSRQSGVHARGGGSRWQRRLSVESILDDLSFFLCLVPFNVINLSLIPIKCTKHIRIRARKNGKFDMNIFFIQNSLQLQLTILVVLSRVIKNQIETKKIETVLTKTEMKI